MEHRALDVNWQDSQVRLVALSGETIRRFASTHREVACSFFADDVDLPFVLHSFDTPDNALRVAQETERDARAERARMLALPTAWQGAEYFSTQPPALDYSSSTDAVAYHAFADIKIDEGEDMHCAADYPRDETADDYAEGITRIVLWRVIERRIESDALRHLRRASPFRSRVPQLHDHALTVVRILTWPQLQSLTRSRAHARRQRMRRRTERQLVPSVEYGNHL